MSVSPLGTATPPASQAMSLRSLIRQGSRVFYKSAVTRSISRKGAEKAIELKMVPLLPLIVAASALLYNEGQKLTGGGHSPTPNWRRMLVESGVSYAVIENTKGVYPLWGLGLAAYRAGQKKSVLEKLQAAVSTAITLVMGYMGVNLFAGITEAGIEMEDQELRQFLSHGGMQNWASRLTAHADDEVKMLGGAMQALQQKLAQQDALYASGVKPDWKVMRPLRGEISSLKSEIFARLQELPETAIRPSGLETLKLYGGFRQFMQDSQQMYVKATRMLNPLFGYILIGLMAGSAVAAYANKKLAKRYPSLKQMQLKPIFDQSITLMPATKAAGPGGAHGPMLPGPYMVWPDVGNGTLH